jgi:hypothetical protein
MGLASMTGSKAFSVNLTKVLGMCRRDTPSPDRAAEKNNYVIEYFRPLASRGGVSG